MSVNFPNFNTVSPCLNICQKFRAFYWQTWNPEKLTDFSLPVLILSWGGLRTGFSGFERVTERVPDKFS